MSLLGEGIMLLKVNIFLFIFNFYVDYVSIVF